MGIRDLFFSNLCCSLALRRILDLKGQVVKTIIVPHGKMTDQEIARRRSKEGPKVSKIKADRG